jgi:hypothetical protein
MNGKILCLIKKNKKVKKEKTELKIRKADIKINPLKLDNHL